MLKYILHNNEMLAEINKLYINVLGIQMNYRHIKIYIFMTKSSTIDAQ